MPGADNDILTSDGAGGINAETNFTYDGNNNILTLTTSYDKVDTVSLNTQSTTVIVDKFTPDFGCAAFFEYCITESGGAKRMGQVYATWDSSSAVFTDVSTPDLNGSTAGLKWDVTVAGGFVNLYAKINAGTWDILVATRIIF